MNPQSKPFAWLGAVASIMGILGFLAQYGLAPTIFSPLKASVGLPLWLIIILPLLPLLVIGVVVDRATRRLLEKQERIDNELQSTRKDNDVLARELADLESAREYRETAKHLQESLARYTALEQEIIGLLAGGQEMNLSDIIDHTSVSLQPDRRERVTRAIAALGSRIDGSGGKYRLSRDAQQLIQPGRENH
jgi:hypothetical protein